MKIYEMTATFGKLQHETLTLQPGLNIIEAPNEWGKSTWCAFLCAMLYGLDTRAKTTKTALADKEHYQPWSGQPMSGRIDMQWQGRDITIERRTVGRIPLGEFRAYETETGIPVPELTADTCGEQLVGVEQSVFRRAGFVRLTDLPVTGSEDLNRRLNALVTTGDESGDGERLGAALKELKNKCRYNRTGLLPEALAQRDQLREALEEQKSLQAQYQKQEQRLQQAETWISQLNTHMAHLQGERSQADAHRVDSAREALERSRQTHLKMQGICGELPSQEEAEDKLRRLREFSSRWSALVAEARMLPQQGKLPRPPRMFEGLSPQEAMEMVAEDDKLWQRTQSHSGVFLGLATALLWILAGVAVTLGLMKLYDPVFGWAAAALLMFLGIITLSVGIHGAGKKKLIHEQLLEKYGHPDPAHWRTDAQFYCQAMDRYVRENQKGEALRRSLEQRMGQMKKQQRALCGDQSLPDALRVWQDVCRCWRELDTSQKAESQARSHLEDLEAMAQPGVTPEGEDCLTCSEEETNRLLEQVREEARRLRSKLNQCQGRIQALSREGQLQQRYDAVQLRIGKLEEIIEALTIAQENLEAASNVLQRRFSPRISGRAQELLSRMTEGRYARLLLGEDFTLGVGAQGEDTLHSVLWRSEGTSDQIYLALRLAVSETLTPEAPLILDDALVRFDDRRLNAVLEILQQEGEHKQVLLFTCQDREGEKLPQAVTLRP